MAKRGGGGVGDWEMADPAPLMSWMVRAVAFSSALGYHHKDIDEMLAVTDHHTNHDQNFFISY